MWIVVAEDVVDDMVAVKDVEAEEDVEMGRGRQGGVIVTGAYVHVAPYRCIALCS